jgi:hypothetical protein
LAYIEQNSKVKHFEAAPDPAETENDAALAAVPALRHQRPVPLCSGFLLFSGALQLDMFSSCLPIAGRSENI